MAPVNISDPHPRGCAGDLGQDSDSRSLEDEEHKPVPTAASRRQVNELSLVPEINVQSSGGAVSVHIRLELTV
jgi:hypothetical protein